MIIGYCLCSNRQTIFICFGHNDLEVIVIQKKKTNQIIIYTQSVDLHIYVHFVNATKSICDNEFR